MATYPNVRIAKVNSGGPPATQAYAPTAASTFKAGDIVRLLQAGTVSIAVDDETTALGVALTDAEKSAGVLNTAVTVALFNADTVFSIRNSGVAFTDVDKDLSSAVDLTAGQWSIVNQTAGNALCRALEADPTDSSRVLFCVLAAKAQGAPFGTAAADAA